MHRPLLLSGARQLLTLRGPGGPRRGAACLDLGIIPDGSILIRDGRIVSVGQSRRVDNLAEARDAEVYDVHGAVVMPGFVDADLALPDSPLLLRRLLHLAFFHGSTTLGARAPYNVLRGLTAPNPSLVSLVAALEVDPEFDEPQLARAFHRNLAQFLRIDLGSHSRDALRFLHTLSPAVRAYAAAPDASDWIGLALAFGASTLEISRPPSVAHLRSLAECNVCTVVTPAAADLARTLLEAGVAVALGSGFVASSGATCSMQAAALHACRVGQLDIAEAITLSTINSAHALGVAASCGSLEVGKRANILVLHLSDVRDLPNYHGVNVVSKIFQAGNLVS